MLESASIRPELDKIASLLSGMRGAVPGAYAGIITDMAWLRKEPGWAAIAQPPRRWGPGFAAGAVVAGLFAGQPGWAAPYGPPAFDMGIPAPPIVPAFAPFIPVQAAQPTLIAAEQPARKTVAVAVQATNAPIQPMTVATPVQPTSVAAPVQPTSVAAPAEPVTVAVPTSTIDLPFENTNAQVVPAKPTRHAVDLPFKGQKTKKARHKQAVALHKPYRLHVIKPGDTLIKLARLYYKGVGTHWKGIFAINKGHIRDAHRVFPGDTLVIPTLAEAIAAERGQSPRLTADVTRAVKAQTHGSRRHKTRLASRDLIVKARPGVPI